MTDLNELAGVIEYAGQKPATGEWIDHDGEGRPHKPTSFVEVEFRDGATCYTDTAVVMWPHDCCPLEDQVMRWRFAERPLSVVELGRLVRDNATEIAAALKARAMAGDR